MQPSTPRLRKQVPESGHQSQWERPAKGPRLLLVNPQSLNRKGKLAQQLPVAGFITAAYAGCGSARHPRGGKACTWSSLGGRCHNGSAPRSLLRQLGPAPSAILAHSLIAISGADSKEPPQACGRGGSSGRSLLDWGNKEAPEQSYWKVCLGFKSVQSAAAGAGLESLPDRR